MGGKRKNSRQVQVRNRNGGSLLAPDFSTAQRQRLASPPQMPVGPPPRHLRRAMPPASFSVSAPTAIPPPPPLLYLRRPVIAAAAALAALLLFAAAYAPWRADYPPAALLSRPAVATRFYSFDLVREYPHDPDVFTQGLLYGGNGILFESTGFYHRVLDHHQMDGNLFGEGLTLFSNRLFQVTWLKNDGFIYDRHNFSKIDRIARVSPEDGLVVGWIFLHEMRRHLWNSGNTNIDVLNGIAWDEENHRLIVTEKLWPKLYEIKLRPVDGPADGYVGMLCPKASLYR